MIIKVKELCWVDCINEEDEENEERLTAIRIVIYESKKDNLKDAFNDYCSDNFDSDNIIESEDKFDGGCLDVIKYLSVEECENY